MQTSCVCQSAPTCVPQFLLERQCTLVRKSPFQSPNHGEVDRQAAVAPTVFEEASPPLQHAVDRTAVSFPTVEELPCPCIEAIAVSDNAAALDFRRHLLPPVALDVGAADIDTGAECLRLDGVTVATAGLPCWSDSVDCPLSLRAVFLSSIVSDLLIRRPYLVSSYCCWRDSSLPAAAVVEKTCCADFLALFPLLHLVVVAMCMLPWTVAVPQGMVELNIE